MKLRRKKSTAERVYEIAKKLKIPQVTVDTVVREYLKSLEVSALSGENIVVDNIFSIKLLEDTVNGGTIARGGVSSRLKARIKDVKLQDRNSIENIIEEVDERYKEISINEEI